MELITNNSQLKEKLKTIYPDRNIFDLPTIKSVVIHIGTGRMKDDDNHLKKVQNLLAQISGQKPIPTIAKKSIAAFKVRKGAIIGYKVTLRGRRAYNFLNKLFHITVPRIRDFRGFSEKLVNDNSFNLGLKESEVFPEASLELIEINSGLQIVANLNNSDSERTKKVIELLSGKFQNK